MLLPGEQETGGIFFWQFSPETFGQGRSFRVIILDAAGFGG